MSVNILTGSPARYFKSGEDVPDELVSPAIARYAVSEDAPKLKAQRANADPMHLPRHNGTHVKRGVAGKRIEDAGKLEPGER